MYRPAGTGEEVGGDFYDVFEVASQDWAVSIGDVCGKGVDAAVLTALTRHALRAAAVPHPAPSTALRTLNDVLLRHETDRFCTVAFLRLRQEQGTWTATVSCGGHPLPLMASPGDTRRVGRPAHFSVPREGLARHRRVADRATHSSVYRGEPNGAQHDSRPASARRRDHGAPVGSVAADTSRTTCGTFNLHPPGRSRRVWLSLSWAGVHPRGFGTCVRGRRRRVATGRRCCSGGWRCLGKKERARGRFTSTAAGRDGRPTRRWTLQVYWL